MMPSEEDKSFIWDMVDACNDIIDFTKDINFHDFADNKMARFAVERQLLVIGEAANHLSEDFRLSQPEIPWRQIIGLRNIIAHEYGDILTERIWKIATENIFSLKRQLTPFL